MNARTGQNGWMASLTCPFCARFSHVTIRWGLTNRTGKHVRFAATCDQCGNLVSGETRVQDAVYGASSESLDVIRQTVALNESAIEWWPKVGSSPTVEDVPEAIGRAAREAYSSASVSNHMAAILMARTVIEACAKHRGIVKGTLSSKIDAMRDDQLIRPAIAEQAHEVRFAGNDMAHGDIDVAPDAVDSEEILALMSSVLTEVFQDPARLARIRAKRQGGNGGSPTPAA